MLGDGLVWFGLMCLFFQVRDAPFSANQGNSVSRVWLLNWNNKLILW